mmetsp:Transcript_59603/g.164754  ORF Transcript_59603/g.164754 Transcript_59603/m.164754 type:complete len:211 (+) Transcript_59603:377-1009(+)
MNLMPSMSCCSCTSRSSRITKAYPKPATGRKTVPHTRHITGGQQQNTRAMQRGSQVCTHLSGLSQHPSMPMRCTASTARATRPVPALSSKPTKNLIFRSPMQVPIQKQWWSRRSTQRPQKLQWPQRCGRQSRHWRHHFCFQRVPLGSRRSRMRCVSSNSSTGPGSSGFGSGVPGSTKWHNKHIRIAMAAEQAATVLRQALTLSRAWWSKR